MPLQRRIPISFRPMPLEALLAAVPESPISIEVILVLSTHSKPLGYTGIGLLLLTIFKSLGMSQGSPTARMAVGLCLLLLAVVALLILFREGYEKNQLFSLLLPIALALFLRSLLLDHATLDYQDFLSRWVAHFRDNGGFSALKDPVGNYNVPYLYMLAFLSYLPIPDLYGIKLFSILFDFLLAWGGLRLTKVLTRSKAAPLWAFSILLLLPTVVLNGSCWGQCDSVWAALCVWALSFALEERPIFSLTFLALAFSFKLQAIFILPLWGAFWFTRRVRFRQLFVFPGIFFLSTLPALLAGKPMGDILQVYLNQAGDSVSWKTVNYNSPSVFALLPYHSESAPWVPKLAITLAFLFTLGILVLLFLRRKKVDNYALALAGTAMSLGIPFLLPYMHERYFFLGGVLLVIISCAHPALAPGAAGAELASLGGYHAYLMKRYVIVLTLFGITWTQLVEGLLMLGAIGFTLAALRRQTT